MRAALIAAALAVTIADANASPTAELDLGRSSFRGKDYPAAIRYVNPLLYPKEELALPADLVAAHELLGASKYETGLREEAKNEFEKALQLDPDTRLDPLFFSSGAIRVFEETRADMEAREKRDAELRKLQDERDRLKKFRDSLVVYENRPYYLNFVPFGAGQFQNKSRIKGVLFAAGEGLTFGASTGIWFYLVNKYGINCPHCVLNVDKDSVVRLEQIEVGAGIAFFALYALGVVDSLLHYKPQARVQGDDSLLPPELRDLDKKPAPKKTSVLDHLHVVPMVAPNSVGVGLVWEN